MQQLTDFRLQDLRQAVVSWVWGGDWILKITISFFKAKISSLREMLELDYSDYYIKRPQ